MSLCHKWIDTINTFNIWVGFGLTIYNPPNPLKTINRKTKSYKIKCLVLNSEATFCFLTFFMLLFNMYLQNPQRSETLILRNRIWSNKIAELMEAASESCRLLRRHELVNRVRRFPTVILPSTPISLASLVIFPP